MKNEEIRDAEISTEVIFALNTNRTFVDTTVSLYSIPLLRPRSSLSTLQTVAEGGGRRRRKQNRNGLEE